MAAAQTRALEGLNYVHIHIDQWSQIPISLKRSGIRICVKVISCIRIRIKVKIWIRIRINEWKSTTQRSGS
jgi:hypothetical protein